MNPHPKATSPTFFAKLVRGGLRPSDSHGNPKQTHSGGQALAHGLRVLAASLTLAGGAVYADPFATDRVPIFTVSETYAESIAASPQDGYTEYSVTPNRAGSKLVIAAKFSAKGIDLTSVDEVTPVSISIGDFQFEGLLGDAETWLPAQKIAVFRITTMDEETYDDIDVGSVTVKWSGGVISYAVSVADPSEHGMLAPVFAGEDTAGLETELLATVAFGDFSMDDRNVYLTVDSSVVTRSAGSGDDAEEFDLSSVRLRGGIDSVKPRVSFGTLPGDVVTTDRTDLSGAADDNIGVAAVYLQVNDGGIESLPTTDGHWSFPQAALRPGANTIRVQAVDMDGNESAWLSRSVRYLTPLTVTKTGEGVVTSGFLGTSLRTPCAPVTVKAVPAAGYLFRNWSGVVNSSTPNITFTVAVGSALQANFVRNPFPAVRGGYSGLVTGAGPGGSIALTLQPTGVFSAKLKLDGAQLSLSGTVGVDGIFHGTIPRSGRSALAVDLALDVSNGTGALSGTISDGDTVSEINGERSLADSGSNVPHAGKYTLWLPGSEDGTALPGGDGTATLTVDDKGVAALAGTLGDGTAVTASAPLTQSGALFLQLAPYSGEGMLQGRLVLADEPGQSDLYGTVRWVKPASGGAFYPAGFDTSLELFGSEYLAPAPGQLVLPLPIAANNLSVALGGGNLRNPIIKTATLAVTGRVTVTAPGPDRLAININSATGYLSGTFVDPANGAARVFKGVVFQKQGLGAGEFRGVNKSGSFLLTAH